MTLPGGGLLARFGLKRRTQLRLLAAPGDPIEGDPARAQALKGGELRHRGARLALENIGWDLEGVPSHLADYVHGFAWLRDLAAGHAREEGAAIAQPALTAWMRANDDTGSGAWHADRAGSRLVFWAMYAPYILSAPDSAHRRRVLSHYMRSAAAAEQGLAKAAPGLPRIKAAAGIIMAGLVTGRGEGKIQRSERTLRQALDDHVRADGQVATRSPADILPVLAWLQMLRAGYRACDKIWPEDQRAIEGLLRTGLRAARLGDGRLAAMHGGNVLAAARIEAMLSLPGKALRQPPSGEHSGLKRLQGGGTVVVMDAGPPPPAELGTAGHAGALAFEMSDGAARMIVNVGGAGGLGLPLDARLGRLVRTSAAHSTLIVDDTNQSEVPEEGPLGKGVDAVALAARENREGMGLEASHDGYQRRFGLTHARTLFLSADGRDLRGEDRLEPGGGKLLARRRTRPFAVRFHLMPGIDPVPTADMAGALIRLAGGATWQMKLSGGELEVDDSLWIGEGGRAERCRQLVIRGETDADGATVRWSFKKMG